MSISLAPKFCEVHGSEVLALCSRAGLDVFEDEPFTKPGLTDCDNAVIVPHIASASLWTRAGMVRLYDKDLESLCPEAARR
jgi:lactate dehydrogenase-like 2-hydroxyacid dehydrogenase